MVDEILTIEQAVARLDEIASGCEDANYHTEAGVIWRDVIPAVERLTERAIIFVTAEDGLHTLTVQP